jgi:hypothetical protein
LWRSTCGSARESAQPTVLQEADLLPFLTLVTRTLMAGHDV